jgi:hypothetical protein
MVILKMTSCVLSYQANRGTTPSMGAELLNTIAGAKAVRRHHRHRILVVTVTIIALGMDTASLVLTHIYHSLVNQNVYHNRTCRGRIPNQPRQAHPCPSVLFLASDNWIRNHLLLVCSVVAGRLPVALLCLVAPTRRATNVREGLFIANILPKAVEGCGRRRRLAMI